MAEMLVNYGEIRAVVNTRYLSFYSNSLGIFFQQPKMKDLVARKGEKGETEDGIENKKGPSQVLILQRSLDYSEPR